MQEQETANLHFIRLLKAAMPYADKRSKQSMEILMKANELIDSVTNIKQNKTHELATCDLQNTRSDLEGMLQNLKTVCTEKERDWIDLILNFTKAQKFYHTYHTMELTGQSLQKDGKNPFANIFGLDENCSMLDIIASLLSPKQKEVFQQWNQILQIIASNNLTAQP